MKWEYKYKNGYLTSFDFTQKKTDETINIRVNLEYTNGNLTKWTESTGRSYTFTYSDLDNKSNIGVFPTLDYDLFPDMVIEPLLQQGYYGKLSKKLVESVVLDYKEEYFNHNSYFEYVVDNKGLVEYFYRKYKTGYIFERMRFYY